MVDAILGRLDRRFVFVVGKGGVGKTTTAGAIALASADGGVSTHLLSTDPAHSLGDLFGLSLGHGRPRSGVCGVPLAVEELDAPAAARAWIERGRAPVLELFDRGTYLDAADLDPFLDLTLPGVDEVGALLRLAALAREPADRIVVDTAPTGHTLRLLDSGKIVEGWARAFDAMGEKAAAVIEALTRRPARLAGQAFVKELEREIERFHEDVVAEARAVVVDRSGTVVEAETRRLVAALRARDVAIGARIRTLAPGEEARPGADASPPRFDVPHRRDLAGCDGLRTWGETDTWTPSTPDAATGNGREALLAALPRSLVLVVGKGGVGKSTCAAAVALALTEKGPVTLLSTDPAGSLEDVLPGGAPEAVELRQVESDDHFEALRTRYRDGVEEVFRRLGMHGGAALDRRVVASFLDLAPPGLDEIFALVTLLDEVDEGRTVVVDSAPTGHLVRLLTLPGVALAWTHQLMRMLLKYRAVLGLDAFAEQVLVFAKRLKALDLKLRDPERTSAVVVTGPGPLVAAETVRLEAAVAGAGIRVAVVIHNRTAHPVGGTAGGDGPAPTRLAAPELDEPPVGAEAVRAFLSSWSVTP